MAQAEGLEMPRTESIHLLTKLWRNLRARTGVADNGVARIAERNGVPLEGGSGIMELGIIEVLLLKGGHLAVVDVCTVAVSYTHLTLPTKA